MKVTVFGATGVVGSALLPLLVTDHELVAVSRSRTQRGRASVGSRATRVPPTTSPEPSRAQRSSTTSSILSAGVTSSGRIE